MLASDARLIHRLPRTNFPSLGPFRLHLRALLTEPQADELTLKLLAKMCVTTRVDSARRAVNRARGRLEVLMRDPRVGTLESRLREQGMLRALALTFEGAEILEAFDGYAYLPGDRFLETGSEGGLPFGLLVQRELCHVFGLEDDYRALLYERGELLDRVASLRAGVRFLFHVLGAKALDKMPESEARNLGLAGEAIVYWRHPGEDPGLAVSCQCFDPKTGAETQYRELDRLDFEDLSWVASSVQNLDGFFAKPRSENQESALEMLTRD